MCQSHHDIYQRAVALGDDIVAGVRGGRTLEWVEEMLGGALLDVMRRERERCIAIAEHRVKLWEAAERGMSSGNVAAPARFEARERRKEALVITDALRTEVPTTASG